MPRNTLLKILEDRVQMARSPAGAICTLCDQRLPAGTPSILLRAPINLLVTTKIVEEYACKSCGELIGNRMLFIVGSL